TFESFVREESDLALVIFLVVEEAITADAMAGDALNAINFLQRIIIRRTIVMAEIVMASGDEELANNHCGYVSMLRG
ncbi:MAG: hypothetical protein ACXWBM_06635, partial [Chthoniobacterales bacterium]